MVNSTIPSHPDILTDQLQRPATSRQVQPPDLRLILHCDHPAPARTSRFGPSLPSAVAPPRRGGAQQSDHVKGVTTSVEDSKAVGRWFTEFWGPSSNADRATSRQRA